MIRTCTQFLIATLVLGAALFATRARADAVEGLYLGGNIGWSQSTYNTGFVNTFFQSQATSAGDTLSFTSSSVRRTGSAWSIDAGYWFGPSLGIDASYIHLGDLTYHASGTLAPSAVGGTVATAATLNSEGPALALLWRLPLTDALALTLRAGDYYGHTSLASDLVFNSIARAQTQSSNASSLLLGAGVGYTLASHWSVRVDYLRIIQAGDSHVGRFDAGLATVGASYTF
jgi:opacity protein-like surface antigen